MVELGPCDIDLFASRLNHQLGKYVAWRPDPSALAVDAFTCTWTENMSLPYCFPPFSVLPAVFSKIEQEEADVVLVAPIWTTQPWFTTMIRLLVCNPVILPRKKYILVHPSREGPHPLIPKMRLGMQIVRENFENLGISAAASEIISFSWRSGTMQQSPTVVALLY